MFQIIIDPDYINDPELNAQKAKLEPHFKNWQCEDDKDGFIMLSHDPAKRQIQDCRNWWRTDPKEIHDMMIRILSDH